MGSVLPSVDKEKELPSIERESIAGAAEAIWAVSSVLLPVGKEMELPSVERESIAGAAKAMGNVLLPISRG
jgi:hypothetical protein